MQCGYGLVTCQRPPDDPRSDAELYRHAIERSVACEQAGFDSVWLSEHHFVDDGYMPSLLVVAGAIAQATSRITLGTAVLLAPLYHPLRLAEDAATVDLLSGGRLVLGLGAGWRPEEFEVLGVPLSERAPSVRRTVRALRGAWSPKAFEWGGRRVNVTPKPAHPVPIWLGGFHPNAIRRAGRLADGFLGSSSATSGIEAFLQAKATALDAVRAAGRDPSTFTFALHVPVYASHGADPWAEVRPYYHYLRFKYVDMAGARASERPAAPPPLDHASQAQLRNTIICGSPEQVVQAIESWRRALGDDTHFIFRSDFPGMPQEQALELIHVLGGNVLPRLR